MTDEPTVPPTVTATLPDEVGLLAFKAFEETYSKEKKKNQHLKQQCIFVIKSV